MKIWIINTIVTWLPSELAVILDGSKAFKSNEHFKSFLATQKEYGVITVGGKVMWELRTVFATSCES